MGQLLMSLRRWRGEGDHASAQEHPLWAGRKWPGCSPELLRAPAPVCAAWRELTAGPGPWEWAAGGERHVSLAPPRPGPGRCVIRGGRVGRSGVSGRFWPLGPAKGPLTLSQPMRKPLLSHS